MSNVSLRQTCATVAASFVVLALADPAAAHTGTGLAGGFSAGFLHPFGGFDHLLAMVSIGLWGAFLGRPLVVALPVIFPAVMAIGGVLGIAGVPLPPVEVTAPAAQPKVPRKAPPPAQPAPQADLPDSR